MAPIFILFGFGLGYLLGKVLQPHNMWGKLLWSVGLPCLIYGYNFLIFGIDTNWHMYQVGLKTFSYFWGCIGLLVSMFIFVKKSTLLGGEDTSSSIEEIQKRISEEEQTNRTNKLHINKYLVAIFSIWMVGLGLSAIGPFVKIIYVGYGTEIAYGITTFVVSMIGVFSMFGMLNQKRWGLIFCIIYVVTRFMSYIIWGGSGLIGEIDVIISLIAFLALVLLLFIREDDYTAYSVIWNNGEKPIQETL